MAVAEVLTVSLPLPFPSRTLPLRELQTVVVDDPGIRVPRIFVRWNSTNSVEPVSMSDVGHSELLDEACDGCCFASIPHGPVMRIWCPVVAYSLNSDRATSTNLNGLKWSRLLDTV